MSVSTGAGCAWTATSNANWLTITGGGAGNGPRGASLPARRGLAPTAGPLKIPGGAFPPKSGGGRPPRSRRRRATSMRGERTSTSTSTRRRDVLGRRPATLLDTLREPGGTGSRDVRGDRRRQHRSCPQRHRDDCRANADNHPGRRCLRLPGVAARPQGRRPRASLLEIEVDTSNACSWTAVSNVEWIAVVPTSGTWRRLAQPENDGRAITQSPKR